MYICGEGTNVTYSLYGNQNSGISFAHGKNQKIRVTKQEKLLEPKVEFTYPLRILRSIAHKTGVEYPTLGGVGR